MGELFFWQKWKKVDRYFYLFLLLTFGLSIIYFLIGWYLGIDAVIKWNTVPQFETLNNPIDSFIQNLIQYSVEVNTFLIKEQYDATGILINPESSYIYFAFVLIGFLYILTLVTFLDLFWFGLGMAFFLFFIATLKTELLQITGKEDKLFLIGLIFSYLGIGYFFHSFRKETSFAIRFLSFTIFTLIIAFVIAKFSRISYPFLFLANFSVPIPMFVGLLFLITIGFENVFGFLYLITSGKSSNPKSRIINFLIITVLYLLNLLLVLMKKMKYLDWDVMLVSPFLVFLVSVIYGIWSYRHRNRTSDFVPFAPYGSFLYLGMAIICTATMGLAFITGNDPMVEMFEYIILYSHLAFGFVFTLYILINFGDLFSKNLSIYKVVYEPRRMPYFIMTGVSLVIMLSLFFVSNRFSYYLGTSGYYNLGGDVYAYQKNYLLANEYYKEGFAFAYQNHRSNYSLASIAIQEDKRNVATEFLTQSLVKNPSEYAFVMLSNLYLEANMFFPSMFILKDGTAKFEDSPYINNNLGLLYSRTNTIDSAFYFLNKASETNNEDPVPATNLLALLSSKNLYKEADSLAGTKVFDKDPAFQNNVLIIKTTLDQKYDKPFITQYYEDSVVDGSEFPYLYNFGIKKLKVKDPAIFDLINSLKKNPSNSTYKDHLGLLTGLKKWYTSDKAAGLKELDLLKTEESTSGYFNKIIGMLLFKQKAYPNAIKYLKNAHKDIDQEAMLYLAIAYLEDNQTEKAQPLLDTVSKSEFQDLKLIAENLKMILSASHASIENWDDELRYQFLHFRSRNLTEIQKIEIFNSIGNPNIKLLAGAEILSWYLKNNDIQKASEIGDVIGLPNKQDSYFAGEANLQYLKLLETQGNWKELSSTYKKVKLNDYAQSLNSYFTARIFENQGKLKEAEEQYEIALTTNIFAEDVYLNAGKLFVNINETDRAYNTFVNGLEMLPNSINLLKEYIKLAYRLNLHAFAKDALERLSGLIAPGEFQKFKLEIKPLTEMKPAMEDPH